MGIMGSRTQDQGKSKDPVCGQVVVEALAVGPEESAEGKVWFCSLGCQAQYQAEHSEEEEKQTSGVAG